MLQMLAGMDWRIVGLLSVALILIFVFERYAPDEGGWWDESAGDGGAGEERRD
jgi:hypothetical protein